MGLSVPLIVWHVSVVLTKRKQTEEGSSSIWPPVLSRTSANNKNSRDLCSSKSSSRNAFQFFHHILRNFSHNLQYIPILPGNELAFDVVSIGEECGPSPNAIFRRAEYSTHLCHQVLHVQRDRSSLVPPPLHNRLRRHSGRRTPCSYVLRLFHAHSLAADTVGRFLVQLDVHRKIRFASVPHMLWLSVWGSQAFQEWGALGLFRLSRDCRWRGWQGKSRAL